MASVAPSCNVGAANYSYISQIPYVSVSDQPPFPSVSCPITPPYSSASSGCVRDYSHEDVGRLADIQEDVGQRCQNNSGNNGGVDIKDIVLLEPETSSGQEVNICQNKITICSGPSNKASTSKSVNPGAQAFLKDTMKDAFDNMSTEGCMSELLVLIGADGGVAIHKSVISAYSILAQEQLYEYPECTCIFLPNYSQKIVRKMVEVLYNGETFYSENEKKDVNLIWEAMRQLQIPFNDKSFYYHPVEFTAVKEEEEVPDNNSQQTLQSTSVIDHAEVDQTDEFWHEDQSGVQKTTNAFTYCRLVRQPHLANPSKKLFIHSKYGEGKKIQRSMPAIAHINADEIREKEKTENLKTVEQLLAKHKPIIIDLLDDDDEDCPTPTKKSRTQTYPASTSVVRDEGFKQLITSGQVSLDMVKTATANMRNNEINVPDQLLITAIPQSNFETQQHSLVPSPGPSISTQHVTERVPAVIIPPNRPEGTGITFMQKRPVITDDVPQNPASIVPEMPTLKRENETEHQVTQKRSVRNRSFDITEIPVLDMLFNADSQGGPTLRDIEASESNNSVPGLLAPAVVIPVSKVNHFFQNPQVPCTSASVASESEGDLFGKKVRKRKQKQKPLMYDCADRNAELLRLREAFLREQAIKSTVVIVGSKKKPIPDDVVVDTYVENLEEDDTDVYDINTVFEDMQPPSSSNISNTNQVPPPAANSLSETINTRGGRGKRNTRGRGRGTVVRGRGRSTVNYNNEGAVEGQEEGHGQPSVPDQPNLSRRGRGGRRGCRGGAK